METKQIGNNTYVKVEGGWQMQSAGGGAVPQQRSFVQELVPTAGAIGGGIIGSIAAAPLGPVGVVAGGIGGATAGGAAGEALQQKIEKSYGQRESYNVGQIGATGAISGVLQATGLGLAKGVGMAANALRPTVVKTMSFLSGYADDVVKAAIERTPGAVEAIKLGEQSLTNLVKRSASKLQDFASKSVAESKKAVAEFDKLSGGGAGFPGTRESLLKEGSNFISNTTRALRSKYNIGVSGNGLLNFDRAVLPSNIVSQGDKGAIQSAFDSMSGIKKNTTVRQLDAIMERLIVLKTKTPAGTPTGGETKQIIGGMMDEVLKFAESLGKYGKGWSDWAQFSKNNVTKRVMIEDMKELFGSTRNLSPKETSQISKKLLQLYNTGNLPIKEAAQTLGKEIGEDITGGAAGTLLKTGDQMSVRAPNLTTRGTIEKILEAAPRAAVRNYIATGKITPELSGFANTTAKTLGISSKSLIQELVSLAENKTTQ